MEQIDIPFRRVVVRVQHLATQIERAGNLRAAVFAQMEKRLPVHLRRPDVVDDVSALDAFIVSTQPGVDPKRLQADQLLLFVAHRAGHVHHVDDHRVGLRLEHRLPTAVSPVRSDWNDNRIVGIVEAGRDLPPKCRAERPLEVS